MRSALLNNHLPVALAAKAWPRSYEEHAAAFPLWLRQTPFPHLRIMRRRIAASTQNGKRRGGRSDAAAATAAPAPSSEDRGSSGAAGEETEAVAATSDAAGSGHAMSRDNSERASGAESLAGMFSLIDVGRETRASGRELNGSGEAPSVDTAGGAQRPSDAIPDAPSPQFRAYLDEVSDTEISGWIMQRDEPSHRCVVALREG